MRVLRAMAVRPLRDWVALICVGGSLAAMLWTFDSSIVRWGSGLIGVSYPTLATVWLSALLMVLCFAWRTQIPSADGEPPARLWASAAALAAALMLALTVSR